MAALFACTKCHSRHPFEELSDGEQLCKECRSNYPIVKCTYCRAEFQQEDKLGTSSICKKCSHNVKSYGKPKACEYCSVIAAFIGNRCQRCANSEKKYGPPQTCEQCKQQCAFDRSEECRKRVDGKLLCWLCTMAYKRVLAKTRSKGGSAGGGEADSTHNTSSGSTHRNTSSPSVTKPTSSTTLSKTSSFTLDKVSSSSSLHRTSSSSLIHKSSSGLKKSGSSGNFATLDQGSNGGSKRSLSEAPSGGSSSFSLKSRSLEIDKADKEKKDRDTPTQTSLKEDKPVTPTLQKLKGDTPEQNKPKESSDSVPPPTKKIKIEKTTSNGIAPTKSTDSLNDFGQGSDNMVAITQLREEVESLKKLVQVKEQQILDRDKKLTELKAENFESEKTMRQKVTAMQKQHQDSTEQLQNQIRDLRKQVKLLSKGSKKVIAAGSPSV